MMRRMQHIGGVNVLVQLTVLVGVAAIVGFLAIRQVQRVFGNTRPVVIAAAALPAGTQLRADHLEVVKARAKQVPATAFRKRGDVEGRTLQNGKRPGQAITDEDFQVRSVPTGTQLSNLIPEGRVLTTLTLRNITVPQQDLRQGDRIDILSSRPDSPSTAARLVVSDAYLVGYLSVNTGRGRNQRGQTLMGVDLQPSLPSKSAGASRGLILALHPDDVLPLAQVDGSSAHISLVLHSRESVDKGEMLTIADPEPPHQTVDVIIGAQREKVVVQ